LGSYRGSAAAAADAQLNAARTNPAAAVWGARGRFTASSRASGVADHGPRAARGYGFAGAAGA